MTTDLDDWIFHQGIIFPIIICTSWSTIFRAELRGVGPAVRCTIIVSIRATSAGSTFEKDFATTNSYDRYPTFLSV